VLGVAAPVRNDHGTVIASISIAALSRRITDDRLPDVVARVCRAAADLTDQIRLVEG
jgi:DNA-binding IclR family transcriptional regulator